MNEALAQLLPGVQTMLWAGFVVMLRVGGAMALLPAFGEMLVPARVKLVMALAFTMIVLPGVMPQLESLRASAQTVPVWVITEPAIGLALGIMLRLFILCLQIAGTIAAQSTSLSQLFGGTTGEPQPAMGELMVLAGLAIAVHLGLHVKVSMIFIGSYQVFPPGALPDADLIKSWGLGGISRSFALAFSIAAPFVLAGLIYNVALGAINRAMPQLMVSLIGAPALTLGGLALLMIALPTGLAVWRGAFDDFLANPFEILR